jgi:hypothetical protein
MVGGFLSREQLIEIRHLCAYIPQLLPHRAIVSRLAGFPFLALPVEISPYYRLEFWRGQGARGLLTRPAGIGPPRLVDETTHDLCRVQVQDVVGGSAA